jgi:hypothetical protein
VSDDYEGPSAPEGDDFTETAKKEILDHLEARLADCSDRMRLIWDRARENQKFQRGGEHQWDPADWKARRETQRPTFTFKDVALAIRGRRGGRRESAAVVQPRGPAAAGGGGRVRVPLPGAGRRLVARTADQVYIAQQVRRHLFLTWHDCWGWSVRRVGASFMHRTSGKSSTMTSRASRS